MCLHGRFWMRLNPYSLGGNLMPPAMLIILRQCTIKCWQYQCVRIWRLNKCVQSLFETPYCSFFGGGLLFVAAGTVPEIGRRTLPVDYRSSAVAVKPAVKLRMLRVDPADYKMSVSLPELPYNRYLSISMSKYHFTVCRYATQVMWKFCAIAPSRTKFCFLRVMSEYCNAEQLINHNVLFIKWVFVNEWSWSKPCVVHISPPQSLRQFYSR